MLYMIICIYIFYFFGGGVKIWHKNHCDIIIFHTWEKFWCPAPPLATKAYTTLVPEFEKHPLFADFGQKKIPFSTEIADFEAQ